MLLRIKAKMAIILMLSGATWWNLHSKIYLALSLCKEGRREKSVQGSKILPNQVSCAGLQSNMTNYFQHFLRSAVSEVSPKHFGYGSCTPFCLLFQKFLPINTTVSLCKAARLVSFCLLSSLISSYEARCFWEKLWICVVYVTPSQVS